LLAFDATSGEPVDPKRIEDGLRRELIDKYRLKRRMAEDPAFDPLKWMGTGESMDRFRELRYR
jgi:hypothetical protein